MRSPAEWPLDLLDVDAARARGHRARPFREFVFKVHQRCNLACDYCYLYTMGDDTWRSQPAVMSPKVWRAAASRIAEHARTHGLTEVGIVLHGGEPLLAGRDRLLDLVADVRAALPSSCRCSVVIQTNGVLLDERLLDSLLTSAIRVGVSLDGPRQWNDRHRRRPNGDGSHGDVDRALRLLGGRRHRPVFAGLLSTVDPTSDPVECYESLLSYRPPAIDFLLPHANWSRPPVHAIPGSTPYGDWLVAVFDRWYAAPRQETRVRILEDVLHLILGGSSSSEQVGLSPVAVAVVESDGSIEQVDSLRSTYPGACATGLNVLTHSFDDALRHPGIAARQLGAAALCDQCRTCAIHRVCGAGHYAHRYRADAGFLNPSVYCDDLYRVIVHVRNRVAGDVAGRVAGSAA